MAQIRRLIYEDFAAGRAFHAALLATQNRRGYQVAAHVHDFFEIVFVLAGEARHVVNGQETALQSGQIAFIRPDDCHSITVAPNKKLHKINVAFPAGAWRRFAALASVGGEWTAEMPPTVLLSAERCEVCAGVFHDALQAFQGQPSPTQDLDMCRFLSGAVPFLLPETPKNAAGSALPGWLADACDAMRRRPSNLQGGLERFVALSGVSHSHLTRTLKAETGQTPTEFVNEIRLTRAATLLTTTDLPIIEISGDCGFAQLSYFYRLFLRRFGVSPRVYRVRATRSVAPSQRSPGNGVS